jgi:hypothetical protein
MPFLIKFQSEEKQRLYLIGQIQSMKQEYWLSALRQFLLSYCDPEFIRPDIDELSDFDHKISLYMNSTVENILNSNVKYLVKTAGSALRELKSNIAKMLEKAYDKSMFSMVNKTILLTKEIYEIIIILNEEDLKIKALSNHMKEQADSLQKIFSKIHLNNSGKVVFTNDYDSATFKQNMKKFETIEKFGISQISEAENAIVNAEKYYTTSGLRTAGVINLKESLSPYRKILQQIQNIRILTEKFQDAYLSNNQLGIEAVLKQISPETLESYYVIGCNYPKFVYHSLSNQNWDSADISRPRNFGNNGNYPVLSPKEYALRLRDFLTNTGYIPSGRELRDNILGIRRISNVFVYFEPLYLNYSMALVAFKPTNLCLLEYRGARGMIEGVIFTQKPIRPVELEIYVREPSKIKDAQERKYASELMAELKILKVPFIIDSKYGTLH